MSFGWALLLPISQNSHIALKHSNNTHTGKKGPLLWVKIVYIEPSFPPNVVHHHQFILQSISYAVFCPYFSYSALFACFIRGVLLKSTILRVQLLRRNHPTYPAALLHPPTWLFGLKEAIVSTSFILLSPFWFLNWKSTLVPYLLRRKPLFA